MDKKCFILKVIVLLLIIITVLSCFAKINMPSKQSIFSALNEIENVTDISITIYYLSPDVFTEIPLSVDDLIDFDGVSKSVIDGNELKKHIDLLKKIDNELVLVKNQSAYIDARLYYVIESKVRGKIFDVVMWRSDGSILVNGVAVKDNDVFYDFIMPFLSEEETNELRSWLTIQRGKK